MLSPKLLDHFHSPRNVGELPPPAVTVDVSNPACGDQLRLSARFENGVAAEVRFLARGCTASIAAGSALTVWMTGKTVDELGGVTGSAIEAGLGGLAPESRHAAALCVDAVRALVQKR
jgi:nitrogen fixation NifU-like protein